MNELIHQLLDQLEPVEQDQQQMRPLSALFYWPLAIAVLLIFAQMLLMKTTNLNFKANKKGGANTAPDGNTDLELNTDPNVSLDPDLSNNKGGSI